MAEIKLSDDEIAVLRVVLRAVVIKSRTGELGIVHGMDRFVSTQQILKKGRRDTLDSVAKKLGIPGGIGSFEG
jgi:hypothetical protein